MPENTATLAVIRSLVRRQDARRASLSIIPIVNVRELTLFWPGQDDALMESCADYLRTYGDSENQQAQSWVTEPIADNETYAGRWRVSSVRLAARNEKSGVYCVLREGFVRTVAELALETPYLVTGQDQRLAAFAKLYTAEDKTLERQYRNIDPAAAITLKDSIKAADSTIRQAVISRADDGVAAINYLTTTRTWVTATKASLTEDSEVQDTADSTTSPRRTYVKDFNNITLASVDVILSDPVRAWATATAYLVGDVVLSSARYYLCITAHTAAAAFATDAAKWQECCLTRLEGDDNTEGGGHVRLAFSRVWRIASASDLAAVPGKVTQTHEILQLFGFDTGQGENLLFVFPSLTADSRLLCEMLTDASLVSSVSRLGITAWGSVPTGTTIAVGDRYSDTGNDYVCFLSFVWDTGDPSPKDDTTHFEAYPAWTYADRKWQKEENGAATFMVQFRRNTWARTYASHKRWMSESNPDGLQHSIGVEVDGVALPATASDVTTLLTGLTADTGYALARADLREAGGKLGVSTGQVEIKSAAWASGAPGNAMVYQHFVPEYGRTEEQETIRFANITNAEAELVIAAAKSKAATMTAETAYYPGPTGHRLRSITKQDHAGDPLFDVVRVTFKPNPSDTQAGVWRAYQASYPVRVAKEYNGGDPVGYENLWRHVCVKFFASGAGADAATWAAGSNAPGGDIHPVLGGLLWKGVAVVDNTAETDLNLTGATPV